MPEQTTQETTTSSVLDPVERLRLYIQHTGLDAELIDPGAPMPTVPLAAAAIGVAEDQILKTLLFTDTSANLVLAIACGPARVDRALLAAVAGLDRLRLADPATVLAATGFPAGGVSPIAHLTPVPVVIDRRVLALDVAYGGGGAEHLLLRIRPTDLQRLTNATVADLTQSS
jgi:Cys-tRNA(Pro) deacylase